MIYGYIFPEEIKIWESDVSLEERTRQPPITRVSKGIRDEALPLFYGTTTFVIDETVRSTSRHDDYTLGKNTDVLRWISTIGKHNACQIRHLRLYGRFFGAYPQCAVSDQAWIQVKVNLLRRESLVEVLVEHENGDREAFDVSYPYVRTSVADAFILFVDRQWQIHNHAPNLWLRVCWADWVTAKCGVTTSERELTMRRRLS